MRPKTYCKALCDKVLNDTNLWHTVEPDLMAKKRVNLNSQHCFKEFCVRDIKEYAWITLIKYSRPTF